MRSDTVKKGIQQAPHRSLFNALGLTEEELQKPLIGVVSSYNEIVPGHMNLDKITEAVKMGVAMAGGVPIMVPAIAVCSREYRNKYSRSTDLMIADHNVLCLKYFVLNFFFPDIALCREYILESRVPCL